MSDEFQLVREALTSGTVGNPLAVEGLPLRRLLSAWAISGGDGAGAADLAVLTRHVLRGEQVRQSGISPTLSVPRSNPWPSATEWERYGIDVIGESVTHLQLRSRAWTPDWLPDSLRYPVDGPASLAEKRREYGEPLRGDPFLDSYEDWNNYRCAGQQEAIRSVINAPHGSTLVVNLPTGSGKSLCAHLPALLDATGITVVVMPTTALALDQERVLGKFIPHPTAYHGGTDASTESRNRGIRDRIKAGKQRIIFASPESVVRSLAGALYIAAGHGNLRFFVIDEAHMVDQWGDDFRAEFQELAGLRQDLLRYSTGLRFKTLLLSGTITEGCLDTLETLFGRPGPFDVLSAVQLRPEPAYWVAECTDETLRHKRVLEAVRHLPRPLILYATRVTDAEKWLAALRSEGFLRVSVVTGTTTTSERAATIQGWHNGQIDIVVATSAFGLGMDKGDVRAVVHACIPEHIDRYYQEVGRGGRDGRASISLLLHTPADCSLADDLNQKTIISLQKGFDRWKAMYDKHEIFSEGRIRVPVDCVPEYGYGEFNESKRNNAWNVHTLALLARSGVIDLDAQPPPRSEEFVGEDGKVDEEKFQAEFERHKNQRVIRLLDDSHLDFGKTWSEQVERFRVAGACATRRGLDLMTEALYGKVCLAEVFAKAYEIPPRSGAPLRPGAIVSRGCGGCAACRREGRDPLTGLMPTPRPAWSEISVTVPTALSILLGTRRQVLIFDDQFGRAEGSERQRRERLLRTLVGIGIRSVVADANALERFRPLLKTPPNPPIFFSQEWQPLYLPRTPTLVFGGDGGSIAAVLDSFRQGKVAELPCILWLPADTRDPAKPHCLLIHTAAASCFRLEEFCTRAGV
jgi:ATP-dependent DNA helicase RecQ